MIFRFIILSDEVDDFRREVRLDSDSNFLDLHNTILKAVGYKSGEMSSFFICSDNWDKETEITLVEMDTSSEVDSLIMKESILSDYLEDEKQKLMLVFDYLSERAFFMELREIIFGESLDKPEITKSIGNPPPQFIEVEEEIVTTKTVTPLPTPTALDEDFYGDEGYNDDELDADGFEGIDDEVNIDDLDI